MLVNWFRRQRRYVTLSRDILPDGVTHTGSSDLTQIDINTDSYIDGK